MLNSYREVLTSLMATAMITASLLPSSGPYRLAGAIDTGTALRAMEAARGGLALNGWNSPAAHEPAGVTAVRGAPIAMASLRSPETDAFQRLAAKAVSINDCGPMSTETTRVLGLTTGEEEFVVYQIKALEGANKHYFNIAKDGSGRVMLYSLLDGMIYIFALDAQQRPIAAAIRSRSQPLQAVTIDSVRPQLHQMLGFWMDWAAQNTSVAQG